MRSSTRTRRAIGAAAAVVLAAAVTACASPADPDPTITASTSPSSTPTPTPTEAAVDPADPTTWIISEEGVGPIEIGGDLATTLASLPDTWTNDPDGCSWSAWWNAPDASYGMYFVRGTATDADPIQEISVYSAAESPAATPSPATEEGLGIGATRADVLAAYPDATEGTAQIGGGTWIRLAGDGDAHVFFEFREGADTSWDVVVTTGAEPAYEVCG